jgi:hypothetical protein
MEKVRATGRDIKDPLRYEKRAEPNTTPLGDPTNGMPFDECDIWYMFKNEIPWLMESDRSLMEIACLVRSQVLGKKNVGVQQLQLLRQILGQMGATPVDRSKIMAPGEAKEEDPAEKFFN